MDFTQSPPSASPHALNLHLLPVTLRHLPQHPTNMPMTPHLLHFLNQLPEFHPCLTLQRRPPKLRHLPRQNLKTISIVFSITPSIGQYRQYTRTIPNSSICLPRNPNPSRPNNIQNRNTG